MNTGNLKLSRLSRLARLSTWKLEPEPSTFAPSSAWSNRDMDPVPLHKRTWTMLNYIAYWVSDAMNVASWELASSMLAIGLSWQQALPAITVGHVIIAIVMVLNGTIGARLHIPFPVLNRSSFGFWLSYFSVISRVVLSMFWFGIQTFVGMICYFLYWSIQFPFMLVSPQRIRKLFLLKAIIVPPTWLALLIWAFVKVPPNRGLFAQKAVLNGSELSWAWLSALNSALGNYATLGVNIPDFTSFHSQYVQLIIIPIAFTFASFVGIAVTSAGITLYGQVLWDPLKLINQWDNRAAAFFVSFAFVLSTLGTNISANSLSAGNDMTALCPRYINIRRGQIICAFLGGWVLCPWEILASATGFLSFMGGYTVFLGPITGVMITDYWLVHRTHVDVPSMYQPHGRYRYTYGVNWRAAAAMMVSVPLTLPGLINNINAKVHVGVGTRLFDISYVLGFTVASTVYFTLSKLFPAHETILDRAVLERETLPDERGYSGSDNKKDHSHIDLDVLKVDSLPELSR
ncbi:cytosine-purine permease [Lactifluus subvellereus]|nr:cytosine-purine permease [Lactifluus subvellereus]